MKGEIEIKLNQLQEENSDIFEAYLARVGSVIPPKSIVMTVLGVLTNPLYPALKAEEMAAAMIEISINGSQQQVVSHDELKVKGRALLDKST